MTSQVNIGQAVLELRQGNIVDAGTVAIVNAANTRLAGGGGVDGAIHRAAGLELYDMTARYGYCSTGSAVITGAGRIPPPTEYIIHAVGPVYRADKHEECEELLISAYRSSLDKADEVEAESIAFPSISTGAYGYPIELAAPAALRAVRDYLGDPSTSTQIRRVLFVLFSEDDLKVYASAIERL